MSLVRAAFHESAHALLSRDFRRPLELVAISPDGGVTKASAPFAGDGSDEELERAVVLVLAGEIGATYAPAAPLNVEAASHAGTNGGPDPYAGLLATAGLPDGPSDHDVVERAREILGDEAIERARALAVELVERKATTGILQRLADELLWRGALTGDELERILAPAA
jgi:hypothetical protein